SAFADLTGLARLPRVKLAATAAKEADAVRVTVRNPGPALAFMVRLRLTKGKGGEDVTPVFWDDNYVSLVPGEERTLVVRYDRPSLEGKEPVIEMGGWNAEAASLEP